MLKSLLLHAGGALLLFQFLVLVTTLPLPREKETHMQLESILDLAETCEQRPAAKELFVEDLSHLAEGNSSCGNEFFCKAQAIFKEHQHVCDNNSTLFRHLVQYNKKVNCKKTVKRSTSVDMEVQMVALLKKVQHCVRLKIFHQRPQ